MPWRILNAVPLYAVQLRHKLLPCLFMNNRGASPLNIVCFNPIFMFDDLADRAVAIGMTLPSDGRLQLAETISIHLHVFETYVTANF